MSRNDKENEHDLESRITKELFTDVTERLKMKINLTKISQAWPQAMEIQTHIYTVLK